MNKKELPAPPGLAAATAVKAVRFYQRHISGLKMASTCRFSPTCSSYAVDAITYYGAARGIAMATIRLLKCGPWHPGGYDPVIPPRN